MYATWQVVYGGHETQTYLERETSFLLCSKTMVSLSRLFSLIKKLALFVLVVAIAIPFRYGSTNPKYLCLRIVHVLFSIKHSLILDRVRPTLSADYRAFESLLRMRPSLTVDIMVDPLEMAKKLRLSFPLGTIVPRSTNCQINQQVYEYEGHTVDAYWINQHGGKEQRNTDEIVIYLHGGAYLRGDVQSKLVYILRSGLVWEFFKLKSYSPWVSQDWTWITIFGEAKTLFEAVKKLLSSLFSKSTLFIRQNNVWAWACSYHKTSYVLLTSHRRCLSFGKVLISVYRCGINIVLCIDINFARANAWLTSELGMDAHLNRLFFFLLKNRTV